MNIPTSDLHKGNLVNTEHGVLPVRFLAVDSVYVTGFDGRVLYVRMVEGVETCHSLMMKYGFVFCDDVKEFKGNDRYYIYPNLNGCFTLPSFKYSLGKNDYKYFHEIQNLIYWLTKQELKINQ